MVKCGWYTGEPMFVPNRSLESLCGRQCMHAHGGCLFCIPIFTFARRYLWFKFNFRFRYVAFAAFAALLFEAHWMCIQFVNWTSDADVCVCVLLCRVPNADGAISSHQRRYYSKYLYKSNLATGWRAVFFSFIRSRMEIEREMVLYSHLWLWFGSPYRQYGTNEHSASAHNHISTDWASDLMKEG